jgi:type IV pilus assembly protein PilM
LRVPLVYKGKSIFGLDIGGRTIKVVQVKRAGHKAKMVGYGEADFPADVVVEGIISDPKTMANSIRKLVSQPAVGHITAGRAAIALPTSKVFIRIIQLPPMSEPDLVQAIRLEAEQYVPVPINDLYIDHEIVAQAADQTLSSHTNVKMVAAPRAIVDSYIKLCDMLGYEVGSVETSLDAIARAMRSAGQITQTTLIIDFGSTSADIAITKETIQLTGTVAVGGDMITKTLAEKLKVTSDQATEIKYKFGLGPSDFQAKVVAALEPNLNILINEIKKVVKYYAERSENKDKVRNVILAGGSAPMPGLIDYLSSELALPIQIGNPWGGVEPGGLAAPAKLELPMYATALGLALHEVSRD